jgi:hypothetical protein
VARGCHRDLLGPLRVLVADVSARLAGFVPSASRAVAPVTKVLRSRVRVSLLVMLCLVAWSSSASADIPPPDSCDASKVSGSKCNNAGKSNDQPGVCVASTCPAGDGATKACLQCQVTPGGSSLSSLMTKAGCSLSPFARDGATLAAMLGIGLVALGLGRRRRG